MDTTDHLADRDIALKALGARPEIVMDQSEERGRLEILGRYKYF